MGRGDGRIKAFDIVKIRRFASTRRRPANVSRAPLDEVELGDAWNSSFFVANFWLSYFVLYWPLPIG
jgi:hypothetical protein